MKIFCRDGDMSRRPELGRLNATGTVWVGFVRILYGLVPYLYAMEDENG
jgi:hypothetical protein